jgi:DNA (cytosine-5)-methyltransferase 1
MREIIVDSFAGGGGASCGIEMALGRSPDIAINHDADAMAMHEVNHPATLHLSKNIWQVDPLDAVGRRPVGLAWFSPDCKHFSKAKGGKPVKRNIRDLAWVVVLWAKRVRPRVIILENVEEFKTWGPVLLDGKPCPERKGQTFARWTNELKRLGYKVEFRELRGCDYGAPTIRKRLFMIARRDGKKIVWPKPSHGRPDDADVIAGAKKPWPTAGNDVVDWSIPCPSIFDTSAEIFAKYGVRAIRPLAEATMKRIARGVVRYVLEAKQPFIVRTDMHEGAARNGVNGVDEPLRTQTTAGSHAIVVPTLVGCGGRAGQSPPRGADEPAGTLTAKADSCVIAAHLTKFQTGSTGSDAGEPVPTVTANSYIKRPGGAGPLGVVAASLIQTGYGERAGQAPRSLDIEAPVGTQMAEGAKHAVVAAFLAQHNSGNDGHDVREPISTLTTGGQGGVSQQGVVAAHLLNLHGSDRRDRPADAPTAMAGGTHAAVVAAHISRQFGKGVGHGVDEPTATDTAGVNKSSLIAAFLTKYYGTGGQWAAASDPMHTVSTRDRMGLVTVEIDGTTFVIVDIGMRMLNPRERFRAQGFPDSYIIDRRPDGSPISQTVQGRCCGNSVNPQIAEALVAANCGDLAVSVEETAA